jgi:hypothetical protein
VTRNKTGRRSGRRLVGVIATLLWITVSCGGSDGDGGRAADSTTAASVNSASTTEPTTAEPTTTGPITVATNAPRPTTADGTEPVFENFDGASFTNSTLIDNDWFPLIPGNQLVLAGTSIEDGEELTHRLEYTVTDFTKEIAGVKTVVVWIEDYSDDELVEVELAFFAQDDNGSVWFFGEHPEEYADEAFVDAPTWIAGVGDAKPGIEMYANPEPGLPPYFQGWAPAVSWSDYGTVDSVGTKVCATLDCYDNVLTIAESSLGEPGVYQLKSYARGVGNIQVDFRGEDLHQEKLDVVEFGPISKTSMEQYRALAIALEAHANDISPTVYGTTPPLAATS